MPKVTLRVHALVALLIGILILAVYAPIFNLTFLSDDWAILRLVTYPDASFREVLRDFYTPLFYRDASHFYRPMYSLSYLVNFWMFGTNPLGYHLTNLALHAVSAFSVYLISLELVEGGRRWGIAVTAGALFALYPAHTEAVTWIAGRVDLICAAFYLPALYFFLRWLSSEKNLYLGLSLGAFALALMSKEMAITLPGLLFLCALYKRQGLRSSVLKILPFAVILGVYLVFRTYILSGTEAYVGLVGQKLKPLEILQGYFYRTAHLFFPVNLDLLLPGVRRFIDPIFILWPVPVALVAGAAYYFGWAKKVLPLLLFVLYTLALVPVVKAIRIDPDFSKARWLYIPSAFLAILIAYLLWTWFAGRVRIAAPAAVVVCAVFFAVLTLNNGAWLRAGEISDGLLQRNEVPNYPVNYKGAHIFLNRIMWTSANAPPFEQRECKTIARCEGAPNYR